MFIFDCYKVSSCGYIYAVETISSRCVMLNKLITGILDASLSNVGITL